MSDRNDPNNQQFGSDEQERAYFKKQTVLNDQFWQRLGNRPEFSGRTVLDLGSGHGAMSIDAAERGARVLGLDLDAQRVDFARRMLEERFPELRSKITFRAADLMELGMEEEFELVLCKDSFEHIADVENMLTAIFKALKPGGELWAGFAPLFGSPWGDHGRAGLKVPWAHVVLPRKMVLKAAAHHSGEPVSRLGDLGLNGITAAEFRSYVTAAGFEFVSMRYNQGDKRMLPVLNRLRSLPGLEKWATVSIYTVVRRPA